MYVLTGFICMVFGFSMGRTKGYQEAVKYVTERIVEAEKVVQFKDTDDGR